MKERQNEVGKKHGCGQTTSPKNWGSVSGESGKRAAKQFSVSHSIALDAKRFKRESLELAAKVESGQATIPHTALELPQQAAAEVARSSRFTFDDAAKIEPDVIESRREMLKRQLEAMS